MEELGCALADQARDVRARAPSYERRETGCGVPLSLRGLAAVGGGSADARAVAGVVV